jgi:phospholipase C
MAGTQRIQHVVVLMLENRSFDHIFGYRPGVNGLSGHEFNLIDPTKGVSDHNPAFYVSNGAPFAVPVGQGPGHSFADANVQQFNNKNGPARGFPARNSGFVRSYQTELVYADRVRHATPGEIRVVMEAFAPGRLPSIDALADAFCVCDNWYSEVPGPTQPNRLYMHAATSAGYALNDWSHVFDFRTIYNNLQDAGCSWATYDFDQNEVQEFSQVKKQKACFRDFTTSFASDVQSGKLPNYSFVIPRFLNADSPANSQHPPQDARYGDNLIADVYDALRANQDVWQKTALIVLYDEHGGLYDHVIPPAEGIPNPDGINSPPPGVTVSWAPHFAFDRLGLRVPAIIASPWIAKGRVDSTRYQHTSVLATLKALFGLKSFLTKRDASASSFESLFSELSAPRTDTPETLPRAALPPVSVSRDDPTHPANQPMDATQTEIVMGVHQMVRTADPQIVEGADLHMTQGDASVFVRWAYDHMYKMARTAGEFHVYRSRGRFHWRLCDSKGKELAQAPSGYTRRSAALAAVKHLQAAVLGAKIDQDER